MRTVKDLLRGVSGAMLKGQLERERKDTQLNIRLSKVDRQSISDTAEALGLSVGEYVLELHRVATRKMQD